MRGSGDWAATRAASTRDRGRLRASEADREQAAEILKVAFVQQRLAKDEFDQRVGRALAALTYADLDALTADLPAAPPARPRPHPAAVKTRRPHRKPSTAHLDHRPTHAFALVAQAAWARRQLISLVAGLLLLAMGVMLPNPVVFVAGIVVVGLSAPQAAPKTPETAMVCTWRWLTPGRPSTRRG